MLPLAAFDISANMELMIPIVALLIPIVAILTGHQRKMAEMMAEQHRALAEIEARRAAVPPIDVNAQYEIATLRDRLSRLEAERAQPEARVRAEG